MISHNIEGYKEQNDKTFTTDSMFPFDSSFPIEETCDSSSDIASTSSFNSSLGILNTSKLLSVSMEGIAGRNTSRDFIDLLNEIEELSFHNKKLQVENERLRAQISQSEETTNQLMTENEQLRLKVSSIQNVLEKTKDLKKEYEEMKTSFEEEEKMRMKLEENVAYLQKENRHLLSQHKDLQQELFMANTALKKCKKEDELVILLKGQAQDLLQQNEILKMELEEESSVCKDFQQVVKEYAKANEVLQQDKSILEVELHKAKEEIQSIAEGVGSSYNQNEDVCENDDSCETDELIYHIQSPQNISLQKRCRFQNCISLHERKEPAYSSTPHPNSFVKNISICAEIIDLIHENDSLPTPICGKEQLFLSCSEKSESSVLCGNSPDETPFKQDEFENITPDYHERSQLNYQEEEEEVELKVIPTMDSAVKHSKEEKILGNSIYDNIQRLTSKNKTLKEKYMKLLSNILQNYSEARINIENKINKNSGSNVVCKDSQMAVENLHREAFHLEKILERLNTEAARVFEGSQAYSFGDEKQPVTVEQIGDSLNILKTEIEKVQAVLASLSRGETLQTKLLCRKATLKRQGFSEDGTGKDLSWRSSDNAEYIANESGNKISVVSTSKTSNQLDHLHSLAYSCPILPSETSLVTKSTQTEPLVSGLNEKFVTASAYNVPVPNKMCQSEYMDERISTCTFPEKELQHSHVPTTGILHDTNAQDEKFSTVSPFVYRNRSFSFVSAIKEGNNDISCCEEATSTEKLECDKILVKPSHEPQKFHSVPVKLDDVKWFRHPKENNESLSREARLTEVQRESKLRTERKGDSKSEVGTGKDQETVRQDMEDSTKGMNSVFVQQMPRVEINVFPSEAVSRISDEELEDKRQDGEKENVAFELKKKDNIVTRRERYSPGSCDQDKEKQERVISSHISEKWKKRDSLSKNKNLIPELIETSETESAKGSASGSMESEAADLPGLDIVVPPIATSDSAFPSIPDSFLRRVGLHKDCPYSNEQLSEQEVESKFGSLSLAFKTDKLTLSKRLELHQRQRNTAEKNIENEIKALKESLNVIGQLSDNHQVRELITSIKQEVDVLQQSTSRVSCRAEVFGAVQQEERVNRAFDIMVMYVENMKRLYEKEHHELEETRRLLMKNHLVPVDSESGGEDSKIHRSRRYLTVSNAPKFAPRLTPYSVHLQAVKEISRRASVAMFHRTSLFERYLSPLLPSGSFIMDNQSYPLDSVVSASGNVGPASISNFNTKLTFSVIPSFPSTSKSQQYSLPIIPPLCLNKPTASLSLPFNVVDHIHEKIEPIVKDKESCKDSWRNDQRERTGNKGKSEHDNTKRVKKDSRGSSNNLQNPEILDFETETIIPWLCHEEPENISRREMEHWAVRDRKLDESTSSIGKIYNKLMRLDSATLQERFRFILSIILVVVGIFCLLMTILPCQATASTYQIYPISVEEIVEILFSPYLTLESPKNII